MTGHGARWLSYTEEQRQAIRDEVRAEHIAQGLGSEPDPAKLAATAAVVRRVVAEREQAAS